MQAMLVATHPEDREFLGHALRYASFGLTTAAQLGPGLQQLAERPVDLIVMATRFGPDLIASVNELRALVQTPLLLLVSPLTEAEHCDLLDAGADLVLPRLISSRLLIRYCRRLVQRAGTVPISVLPRIAAAKIRLNPDDRSVTVADRAPCRLTQLEFRLLYLFMTNQGQVIPLQDIVERVWGYEGAPYGSGKSSRIW